MPLQKSKGNMYPWVTHTHCHLGGQCPHECTYCYVNSFPFGRPEKYKGTLRLIEKEFSLRYGTGKTIFIENCNDMFAKEVPSSFIIDILRHCKEYPNNTYVFQTKNPARYFDCLLALPFNSILGCTIETNRLINDISCAPEPCFRAANMAALNRRKFITIEPILDFDVGILSAWIRNISPEFVNIGADSKHHNLPEPTSDKVNALIEKLTEYGIEIREKHNLDRLLNP